MSQQSHQQFSLYQNPQQQMLPQAYLTNFHNRIRNEDVPLFVTAQPTRGHKRAKVVNYAEVDTDIFDEFNIRGLDSSVNNSNNNNNTNNTNNTNNSNNNNNNNNSSNNNNINNNNNIINSTSINNNANVSNINSSSSNNINNITANNSNTNINGNFANNGIYNIGSEDNSDANIKSLNKFDQDNQNAYMNDVANSNINNNDNGDDDSNNSNNNVNNNNNPDDGNNNEGNNDENLNQEEMALKSALPDIQDQDEQISILRYPKIRETFLQSKIATPYRLNVPSSFAMEKQQEPIMIPISLNLEQSGHTIIDNFTWNINDHSITPDEFATIYCRDLDFPNSNNLHSQIVSTINEQIQEHETVASVVVPDLHVVINLTCNLENRFYEDNFQWNLNDKSLSPEKFAETVVKDLGLTREYMPAIAHALHEYLIRVKKEWMEGQLNQDHVPNGTAFGYLSGIRLDLDSMGADWCPKVEALTPEEIQRREIEKERNMRRLKRESDRMGRRGRRRMDDLETTLRI
ncbi:hypothetical protein Kpol_1062p51 [Vanderwaltozyma polyspora DSM 70294]|uniref:Chromatin structure-remodeling complex subunit SFH1 n=1 Tax=Vanderwaltozyma polyspora (strain ATCC 22028 / DSM 70294 / BCRC 21397 / CBS 2163 / NBRC 10782 / NRRL Y-8283 / UCD 57-17) TaxID=436907 RepID=A7TKA6_VANPO|nr:uncharacterized protein Kpol_1062p51 [Vanderwaltozyma polyspora DSM 70294]EDO17341.1 hypothetical protein Kpol_1062p51 [Vanderwaltozyma polyspora DSM 70294]